MKRVLSLLLVLLMVAGLVACGGSSSGSEAGTYYLVEAKVAGVVYNEAEIVALKGENSMYLKLDGNGKGILSAMGEPSDMEYRGGMIWPVEFPDDKADLTISGNTVKITYDSGVEGGYYIFKKK